MIIRNDNKYLELNVEPVEWKTMFSVDYSNFG